MRRSRSFLAVFAVGALSLSLTACGGDDKNASADDVAKAVEEATNGSVSADEVKDALSGLDDVCSGAAIVAAGMATALTGGEGTDQMDEYFDQALKDAPDEIKDDLTTVSEAFQKMGELIKDNGGDITKAMSDPDVQAEFEALDTPELEAASDRLDTWFTENCDNSGD